MAAIVKRGYVARNERVELCFDWLENPGAGFEFPCDGDGHLLPLSDGAEENYRWCLEHPEEVSAPEIKREEWSYYVPAILRCDCGAQFTLDNTVANRCPRCGALYSGTGERLLPPSLWEDPWDDDYPSGGQCLPDTRDEA